MNWKNIEGLLGKNYNGPERQVDPGIQNFFGWGQTMQPMGLDRPLHEQHAAMFKKNIHQIACFFMLELKLPFCSKAE